MLLIESTEKTEDLTAGEWCKYLVILKLKGQTELKKILAEISSQSSQYSEVAPLHNEQSQTDKHISHFSTRSESRSNLLKRTTVLTEFSRAIRTHMTKYLRHLKSAFSLRHRKTFTACQWKITNYELRIVNYESQISHDLTVHKYKICKNTSSCVERTAKWSIRSILYCWIASQKARIINRKAKNCMECFSLALN